MVTMTGVALPLIAAAGPGVGRPLDRWRASCSLITFLNETRWMSRPAVGPLACVLLGDPIGILRTARRNRGDFSLHQWRLTLRRVDRLQGASNRGLAKPS